MKAVNLWYRACIVLYCVVVYCDIHCVFNSVREMFTYECLQLFVVLCFISPEKKSRLEKKQIFEVACSFFFFHCLHESISKNCVS